MKIKVIEGKVGYGKTSYVKSELLRSRGKTICLSSYDEYAALSKKLDGTYLDGLDISIDKVFDFMNSESEYLFLNFDMEDEKEKRFDFLLNIIGIINTNIKDNSVNLIIDNIESFVNKMDEPQLLTRILLHNRKNCERLNITYTTFGWQKANIHLLKANSRDLSVTEYILGNIDIG